MRGNISCLTNAGGQSLVSLSAATDEASWKFYVLSESLRLVFRLRAIKGECSEKRKSEPPRVVGDLRSWLQNKHVHLDILHPVKHLALRFKEAKV